MPAASERTSAGGCGLAVVDVRVRVALLLLLLLFLLTCLCERSLARTMGIARAHMCRSPASGRGLDERG